MARSELRTHRDRRRPTRPLTVLALAGAAALSGCANGSGADDDTVDVMASFYPLAYVAERVGGEAVTVENLTPGGDAHSVELSPEQVGQLDEASMVIYLSGMAPAVDDALEVSEPEHELDVADAADLADADPHFWLDPTRLATVGHQVADTLAEVDPDNARSYRSAADSLATDLEQLDAAYTETLAPCAGDTLVTSHEAFGYLAQRYDLVQTGITGIEPEVEPSPARLREVSEIIETTGVQTVFFETTAGPETTETLAHDLGVNTDVLDPIEGHTNENSDYLDVMRNNLDALRAGLVCDG